MKSKPYRLLTHGDIVIRKQVPMAFECLYQMDGDKELVLLAMENGNYSVIDAYEGLIFEISTDPEVIERLAPLVGRIVRRKEAWDSWKANNKLHQQTETESPTQELG